jgi:hypothetical protein
MMMKPRFYARLVEVFQDVFDGPATDSQLAYVYPQLAHRLFAIVTPIAVIGAAANNE